MNQYIEFISNHYILCGIFLVLLILLAITEIQRGGRSINCAQLTTLLNSNQGVVVDIRSLKDFNTGHITDSYNIPFEKLEHRLTELNKYKADKTIIIVDSQGQQSGSATRDLKKAGFTVVKLSGGIANWQADGLPLVKKKSKA